MKKSIYAQIIIDLSHPTIDRAFTYKIPEELIDRVYIGCPVRVGFGSLKKERIGYIIEIEEETKLPPDKIKEISALAEQGFSAQSRLIRLAVWMKDYYGSTMSRALMTVLPVKNKIRLRTKKSIFLLSGKEEVQSLKERLRSRRRTAALRLIEALCEEEMLDYDFARKQYRISSDTIRRLESEGCIEIRERAKPAFESEAPGAAAPKHGLNAEQREAFEVFRSDFEKGIRGEYLLYGITGSGKTEVYMEMIREVIRAGRRVIVLIPEIGLTYQTLRRFRAVFGDRLGVINSSLGAGERYEEFLKALNGETDIMIGPRSALFTPFDNTGLIIIDEEHESSYRNESVPRYDSREVAFRLGKLYDASVLLASATPSAESYKKAMDGRLKLLRLSKRANPEASLAETSLVDLRTEFREGNRSIFSRELKELIEDRLEKKEQIMLFMNRRGYSGFVSCRSCGEAIKCRHCDVSLTYHRDGRLRCHYCGFSMPLPKLCPSCSSPYIAGFGVGTQQLESMTAKLFPKARILRLDTDSAKGRGMTEKILGRFLSREADILIGTQMIVKGHDFPNVSLVGIMAADTSLYVSNYTAAERTFQLITQAAGRAGRAGLDSRVVIQTYKPEHYALQYAAKQDFEGFYRQEIAFRNIAGYPPCIHILCIQLSSENERKLSDFADIYAGNAKKHCIRLGAVLIGAIEAPIYKLHDYYRKLVYIKHQDYNVLLGIRSALDEEAAGIRYWNEIGFLYDLS